MYCIKFDNVSRQLLHVYLRTPLRTFMPCSCTLDVARRGRIKKRVKVKDNKIKTDKQHKEKQTKETLSCYT